MSKLKHFLRKAVLPFSKRKSVWKDPNAGKPLTVSLQLNSDPAAENKMHVMKRTLPIANYVLFSRAFLFFLLLTSFAAHAQPGVTNQPNNTITTCPPVTNSSHSATFALDNGNCGNSGTFSFVWQYNNGGTWSTVTNGIPAGFATYTEKTTNTGSGSNVAGSSTLQINLNSSVAAGTYQFRCIGTYSKCSGTPVTSNTINFTVFSKPSPTLTGSVNTICANNAVTYTTEAGQSGYAWVFPGTAGTDYTITSGGNTTSNTAVVKWLTPGSKAVTINYSNANGCTAATPVTTSPATTVNAVPAPTFTAQPSSPICSSTDLTYTTQSGQSNYTWTYSGTPNVDYSITSGGTSTDNSVTIKWLTSGSKSIAVNYTSGGCTAASATSSNQITVNARPVPTFTTSPGLNTCSGTDVTYTTQGGQASYVWNVPGTLGTDYTITSGGIGTSSNTVTLKWLTAGNKTVTVNYTSNGCTGLTAASAQTNVNLSPAVTFTALPGANTCVSTNVTYTTQPGQTNYVWSVEGTAGTDYNITAGGTGSGSNTVTLQWLISGATRVVSVNYTNAGGCSAITPPASTTFVNARPTPTFSTSPSTTTCANTDVTYTTQSGQSNYAWNLPGTAGVDYTIKAGGIGATNNSVTIQWMTAGLKTVSVNYNNANGCNALSAVSSATTVSIPTTPTISGGPTTFCSGGSVTLTASAGSSYQWFKDGATIPGAISGTYTANASGSYTVRVFDASGCNATSAGTTVLVNPLPSITTSAQATSTCFSSSAQVSQLAYSAVTNSPTAYSITWNAGATAAGFTPVSNAALPASPVSITVPANAPNGIYTGNIIVTNANGCPSSSKSFTLEVTAPPDISNFSITAANDCVNAGTTITVNSSTLAAGTYTITYDLSGANPATGKTATVSFSAGTGTFQTVALANEGATDITISQIVSGACSAVPSAGNTASFTVHALPAVSATTGSTNKVCVGSTIQLNNATSGGSWSTSNPSVASVNGSGVVTGIAAGNVDIIYTTAPDANTCSNSYSFPITVNALPTITPITGTTSLCIGTTTKLNNTTTGGTWTSGTIAVATIDNTGLVTASATNAGTSQITYTFPTNANGCTASTTTTVTVDPAATVDAGTAAIVCQSANPSAITLSGATVGGGATTGAWSIVVSGGGALSTTAQTANPATVTYTPAANYSGPITLLLTTNAPGSCPAVSATKSITVSQLPGVTPGPTVTVCQSATPSPVTLAGVALTGGATTAAWSITSGGGTLSSTAQTANPETVTYTPAANYSGPVVLTLTTNTSGACAAATATRNINVTATPTVTPGGPNTICQGSSITLSGSSIGGGATTGAWSITSPGGGTLSTTAQTATPATVTYTPAASFSGAITLTLTTNAPGGCAAVNATRTINVSAPSTATAGGPNTLCQSASPSPVTLTGASVGGGATTGAWSIVSGGGTLSSTAQTASPATVTYTPVANATTTVTLRLTTDVLSGCAAATSDRTITFSAAPTAVAGTAIKTCADASQTTSGAAAVNITAGASASNYTSLLWTSNGSGTFTNPTSLTLATYTPSAADKLNGFVTLTLTAFGNSPCASATSQKTFTITPAIDVNSANNWTQFATCSGSGVQMGLTAPPTGGDGSFTYQWMLKNNCGVAGTSTAIPGATNLTFLPTDLSSCYWLYVSSGGCSTPQNLVSTTTRQNPDPAVIASSLPTPTTSAGANGNTICVGENTVLSVSSAVAYNYTWSPSSTLSAATGASVTANPTNDPAYTTTTYTVTGTAVADPTCSKSATITVKVNPLATLSGVSSSAACSGSTATVTLSGLLANSTSTVNYKIGSGSVQSVTNLVSNGSGVATFTVPVTLADNGQTLTVTQIGSSISAGPSCSRTFSASNTTTLTVSNPIKTQPVNVTKCLKGKVVLLVEANTPANVTTYEWYKVGSGTPVASCATCSTYTIPSLSAADLGQYYVVLKGNLPCATFQSNTITVASTATTSTTWAPQGASNDWTIDANWSCGAPTLTVDADVPDVTPDQYPKIDVAKTGYTKNLTIASTGTPTPGVTVVGNLQIAGTVTNGGDFNATGGTVEYIGSNGTQNIAANTFANTSVTNTVQNLVISNNVNLQGPLNITGALTFGAANNTFTTNNFLTLKSTATDKAARVGEIANGNDITGAVTVERFIPAYATRRYRLASVPVAGLSINGAWQQGLVYNGSQHLQTGTATVAGPTPNVGTMITGQQMGTAAAANALGFDFWPEISNSSASVRRYLPGATDAQGFWQSLPNTTTAVGGLDAYLLFVRGDRTVTTAVNTPPGGITVLRPKGPLRKGAFSTTIPAGVSRVVVGNPYASPLDFQSVYTDNAAVIQNQFWIWQAGFGTGTGGYVLVRPTSGGVYETVPSLASAGPSTANRLIHSGEGFFVLPAGGGTLSVQESHKAAGQPTVSAFRQLGTEPWKLYVNAFAESSGQRTLVDGALAQFEEGFAGPSAGNNVQKAVNTGENLSIRKGGQDLIVASSALPSAGDTVQLRLWNTTARNYQLEVSSKNAGDAQARGLQAFLWDRHLQKSTPLALSSTTPYPFSITAEEGTRDPLRFAVVFRLAPLPENLTTLRATPVPGGGVRVAWSLLYEGPVLRYEVERSASATAGFAPLAQVAARGSLGEQHYQHLDDRPLPVGYYRVKLVGRTGEVRYSSIVSVELPGLLTKDGYGLYPNLWTGGPLRLLLKEKAAGTYKLLLFNTAGQQVWQTSLEHPGATALYPLELPQRLASGTYHLRLQGSPPQKPVTLPLSIAR